MGFVCHRNAYLKDAWNVMDFLIVLVSVINFAPGANSEALKSLRTMRVMRPLRSIGALKSMKVLVQTMFASMAGLFNVCVFMIFMFTIFAIFGVQSFLGAQYNFCRETEELIDDGFNPPVWPINHDAKWLCSSDEMCSGFPNYLGEDVLAKCGSVYDEYGLDPRIVDKTEDLAIIFYDVSNFNNVLSSGITIFQVFTLEGWVELMYNYSDSSSRVGSALFFTGLVVIGAFIALNLVLATIMQSFIDADEIRKEKEKLEEDDK